MFKRFSIKPGPRKEGPQGRQAGQAQRGDLSADRRKEMKEIAGK